MFGFSLKIWSSEYNKYTEEYTITNSVVYLCSDINNRDIVHISNLVDTIVGNNCLEEVLRKHFPTVKDIADDNIKVEVETEDVSEDVLEDETDPSE